MPKSERKFFKQVIEVVILSEDVPLEWDSLEDIHFAVTTGDCSGEYAEKSRKKLKPDEMVKALEEQGSDAEFFSLTEGGEDLD